MATIRRYGQWAGNPNGIPENLTQCVEEVTDATGWRWHQLQCKRNRGFGPNGEYCRQHAKRIEARNDPC